MSFEVELHVKDPRRVVDGAEALSAYILTTSLEGIWADKVFTLIAEIVVGAGVEKGCIPFHVAFNP